jgi:hypothetical protein
MNIYALVFLIAFLVTAANPQITDEKLTLNTQIRSQRYCKVNDKIAALLVSFKIKVVNAAHLAVEVSPPVYPIVLVSHTLDDVRKGNHEFELHSPDAFDQSNSPEPSQKPERHVIHQGEDLEFDSVETTLTIPKTKTYSKVEVISPGTHYLQVVLEMGIEGTNSFVRATSKPMKIRIEENPTEEKCQ